MFQGVQHRRISNKNNQNIITDRQLVVYLLQHVKMDNYYEHSFSHLQPPSKGSFECSTGKENPPRSISKCLRLKTNQSLEGHGSIELRMEGNKSRQTQASQIEASQCRRLAQEEYELRNESLVKQYELRLSKQQEYYELREWKLKQQIQNFQNQNAYLAKELARVKPSREVQYKCSLCEDGQLLTHYNVLLSESEEHHKGCLNQKEILIRKADEATSKHETLEEEHEKVCKDVRALARQLRSCQSKMSVIEGEKDAAVESLSAIDGMWKKKISKLEHESRQVQRELAQRHYHEMSQSKATVQSGQSVISSHHHQQHSLKSSYLKVQGSRQQKQNMDYGKSRPSLSKIMSIDDEDEEQDRYNQNKVLTKLSENIPRNGRNMRSESLKWKYF